MKHTLLFILSIMISGLSASAQEWTAIADMPTGKHHPITFTLDGFGYAVTGWGALGGPSRHNYRYDPGADEWSTLSNFPGTQRGFGIGYAYEGKGYIGFGASTTAYLGDIWEYDPVLDDWTLLTNCPCDARRHPAFLMRDNKIYIGMGDGTNGNMNDWWEYDMVADNWTQLSTLPATGRHHPYMFIANDEIYAGFGHAGNVIYDDWYRYDVANDQWIAMNDFAGEARVAGTQFDHGGMGYVLSGDGDDHSFMETGEFWQYDATDDSWEELTPHPGISLWAPGSFVIGDTVYFIGGENRQTSVITDAGWKYQLPTPEPPLAVESAVEKASVKLYPMPADEQLYISADFTIMQIELLSLSGQLVATNGGNQTSLDVSELPSGVYLARIISTEGNSEVLRWVKQ